jgi:ABC-type glycerol-3-phosphate transport system permease component
MNPVRAIRTTVNNLFASGAGLIALAPIYLVFANALKTVTDASSMSAQPPLNPQWGNFSAVIDQANLVTAFSNSALYSFASTFLAVLLAALAAYVLARRRTRRHEIIYLLLIMGIAIPTNYVTLTKVMQLTHLIDTQIGIILVYAATQIPFDVFLIYAFVDSVPRDLDEAAFIDGCSPMSERKHSRVSTAYACDRGENHLSPLARIFEKSSTSLRVWSQAMYLMGSTRFGIFAKQIQPKLA